MSIKKITAGIAALTLSAAVCAPVFGEDDIKVTIDGSAVSFDVPPMVIDDRTMVPVRAVFNALGATIDWNEQEQKVTSQKDGTVIELTVGESFISKTADSKSERIELDVPALIIDDRTLVPIRAVSESFGCGVDWDEDTDTVVISTLQTAETPSPEPTAAPTAEPTEAPAENMVSIEYDAESEKELSYMKNFTVVSAVLNSDGKYDIEYTVETFLEGRGPVAVEFVCLDASGKETDRIKASFIGSDYAWSKHTAQTTVSGKTVKIAAVSTKK